MRINFIDSSSFGAKIIYNEATKNMRALLNQTSGTKNLNVFDGLVDGINKTLPNSSDKFMFTKITPEDINSPTHTWKAKIIHDDRWIIFNSSNPYVKTIFSPETQICNILRDIFFASKYLYLTDEQKPKLVLPNWTKFKDN